MPTYSHSKLSTFENCPLKFKYRYIDKIELEEEWRYIESFMGKRVHEVLEKLYNDLKTGKLNTLEELLLYYGEIWEMKWGDDVRVIKKSALLKITRTLAPDVSLDTTIVTSLLIMAGQ